jgi:phosphoglycolate phosphatase-like HAD superfamily hydrolase
MDGIHPHGKTDPAIIREIFTARCLEGHCDDVVRQIIDAYVEFLPEEVRLSASYRVLPGILKFLSDYGTHPDLCFGLATGNVERGARIKLERGLLNPFFSFGGFGSDAESRADLVRCAARRGIDVCGRRVSADDIFVIGDTPKDIDAGKAAGFRTVGVATSSYSVADLRAAGADLALSDFERERDQFLRIARIE